MMFLYVITTVCYIGIVLIIAKGIERFVEPNMMEDDEQ